MKSATIFLAAVTVLTTLVPEFATTPVDNVAKNVGGIAGNLVTGVLNITDNVLDMSTLQQAIDKAAEAINQTVSGDVDEDLREKVYTGTARSEKIIADLAAYVEKAMAKTDGVENVVLTKTLVQLRSLQGVAILVHTSIKLAVNSGNDLAVKINVDITKVVVEVTKVELAEMVASLERTPGKVAAAAKTTVQRGGSDLVTNAESVIQDMEKSVRDRGYLEA